MNYAHKQNIIHRDIKPENVLLDILSDENYNLKIIDWGCSVKISNKKLTEMIGTPYYIAPEIAI